MDVSPAPFQSFAKEESYKQNTLLCSEQAKREIIREWILYVLQPHEKSAKEIRKALIDAVNSKKLRV